VKKIILLCSSAVIFPTAALAQSTGSQDFEQQAIIVTGTRTQQVAGVQAPDTPKAKAVLTQEMIARQSSGQTILDTINIVPGVSFQNNDAYGSAGGNLTIRGFDSSRISLTFDGIPLNDSGNYAIYSNQQLDPELIEQVNVNLGSTDVDSPTASAVGGTVNYRTRNPSKTFGGRVVGSMGDFDFRRIFAVVDTGELGPWGTRAWFAVSTAKNDNPFNNYGKLDKQQYNFKVYQPLNTKGDFISVTGNWNVNRNNFFGSLPLRNDTTQSTTNSAPRVVGSGSGNRFPSNNDERRYDINYPCTTATAHAGAADTANSCGTEFDRRYNPSNTGNIHVQSRFTLSDQLVLTVDPSFQYVKANGGGTTTAREAGFDINATGGRANCATTPNGPTVTCIPGYYGGSPYAGGRDLNGDGDILDQVTVIAPSQTRTYRFGVIAGLRYQINDNHTVRASFTYDHANHRQTGQVGLVDRTGEPFDVFPVNNPLIGTGGFPLQKRDRQSYAILSQFAGEYIGSFFDKRLTVNIGARLPFFTRDLHQNCFTSSAANSSGGFVECSGGDPAIDAIIQANNPYAVNPITGAITGYAVPQDRKLKYSKLLPNLGFVFHVTPQISAFANYAKGLSVPSTDNLYNDFFYPANSSQAKPKPELTDSFDGGLRYRSSKIQAQLGIWKTTFKNREAVSFDPESNTSVYRNLGTVDKWGLDGSIAYSPIKQFEIYAFGSLNKSRIQDNIQVGTLAAGVTCDNIPTGTAAQLATALRSCAFTAGKYESGAPKWTYGVSAVGTIGPVDLGITAKKTGPRYVFDTNVATYRGDIDPGAAGGFNVIYPSQAPAYWLVNLDARFNMKFIGLKETYFQLNVYNLFDKFYVGGFGGSLNQTVSAGVAPAGGVFANPAFVQIGAPRTVSGSLSISF
jgi:iron complex outermembrane receptor protein